MNIRHYKQAILVLVFTLLMPGLTSCASVDFWAANRSRVLDVDTEAPIEDAIVVARWKGDIPIWPAEFRSTCYHVESTVTDSEGRFEIPAYREIRGQVIDDQWVSWRVYARGYRYSLRNEETDYTKAGVYWLVKDERTGSERLEYLTQLRRSSKCPDAGESDKNRIFYIKALLDEALELDLKKKDESQIESLRYAYDDLRYGGEEADRRLRERSKK